MIPILVKYGPKVLKFAQKYGKVGLKFTKKIPVGKIANGAASIVSFASFYSMTALSVGTTMVATVVNNAPAMVSAVITMGAVVYYSIVMPIMYSFKKEKAAKSISAYVLVFLLGSIAILGYYYHRTLRLREREEQQAMVVSQKKQQKEKSKGYVSGFFSKAEQKIVIKKEEENAKIKATKEFVHSTGKSFKELAGNVLPAFWKGIKWIGTIVYEDVNADVIKLTNQVNEGALEAENNTQTK